MFKNDQAVISLESVRSDILLMLRRHSGELTDFSSTIIGTYPSCDDGDVEILKTMNGMLLTYAKENFKVIEQLEPLSLLRSV